MEGVKPLGKNALTRTTTLTFPPLLIGASHLGAGTMTLSLDRNEGVDAVDLNAADDADVKEAILGVAPG